MIIAIAGPIGVGKSTVARGLAERLGYRYLSAGEAFREMARQRGLSVLELNRLAESDPSVDREVDRMQAALARAGNCVVESRLAGWMVQADLRAWLRAPLAVRAARVARRESTPLDTAEQDLRQREESERQRYRELYGIDITDLSPYQIVLDTSRWSAEDVVDVMALLAERMVAAGDAAAPAAGERAAEERAHGG
jgi:cytidylate kinase